jgi:hypothetical protein
MIPSTNFEFLRQHNAQLCRACRIKVEPLPGKLFSHFGHD